MAETAKKNVLDAGGPSWVANYDTAFVENNPLMIAVLVNPKKGGLGGFFNQPLGSLLAGSACIQNIMLAAAELGYESLWFTFFDPEHLKPVLNIPEHMLIAGLVLIGKPIKPSRPMPRKEPKVHRQKYQSVG